MHDVVQGDVRFENDQLDDMVLLRSDGTPTYMLAVVVDDHDMGVTHVIRGDDHLNNAARQLQIIEAMGWPVPVYGHVPLIHGPDGAKLSKRHGALAVEAYRDMGYLPEAMRNYLLRLGWSHGDDEIISDRAGDRMVQPREHRQERRRGWTSRSSTISTAITSANAHDTVAGGGGRCLPRPRDTAAVPDAKAARAAAGRHAGSQGARQDPGRTVAQAPNFCSPTARAPRMRPPPSC